MLLFVLSDIIYSAKCFFDIWLVLWGETLTFPPVQYRQILGYFIQEPRYHR
jgi:hypothetical protein